YSHSRTVLDAFCVFTWGDVGRRGKARLAPTEELTLARGSRFGCLLNQLGNFVRVRNHRHVTRLDFDSGSTHTLSEQTLGIGRNSLVVGRDHVPRWQRFPGRDIHHFTEDGDI